LNEDTWGLKSSFALCRTSRPASGFVTLKPPCGVHPWFDSGEHTWALLGDSSISSGWYLAESLAEQTDVGGLGPYPTARHIGGSEPRLFFLFWVILCVIIPAGLGEGCVGRIKRLHLSFLGWRKMWSWLEICDLFSVLSGQPFCPVSTVLSNLLAAGPRPVSCLSASVGLDLHSDFAAPLSLTYWGRYALGLAGCLGLVWPSVVGCLCSACRTGL
jgi:hypothetical protein